MGVWDRYPSFLYAFFFFFLTRHHSQNIKKNRDYGGNNLKNIFFAETEIVMETDKQIKTDGTTARKDAQSASATPQKKKFKLHKMTKKELLETRIPVYDYLIP